MSVLLKAWLQLKLNEETDRVIAILYIKDQYILTKDPLHLFTLFDLIDMFSLECINTGIELKQVQETYLVKIWMMKNHETYHCETYQYLQDKPPYTIE